jgi:DNA-binding MarR family transcriptional regulator
MPAKPAAPTATDHARDLKRLLAGLGRLRPLRDPLSSLGHALTPPQLHCVLWLGLEGALSSRVLSERVGCGQPTVTGVVDRLAKIGLVKRTRATDDRRVVRVTLTAPGVKLYRVLDKLFEDRLAFFLGLMSARDRAQFLRIIGGVVDELRSVVAVSQTGAS